MTVSVSASPAEVTDLDLVRLAQSGDAEAFGELVRRHRRAVFRAALACVRSPDEADDVAQEAFVAAFRKLAAFRGDAQFRTWLLAITWRKAIDRRQSVVRWFRRTAGPAHDWSDEAVSEVERLPAGERSPEELLAADELQRLLTRLIGTLPRKLRDALLLAGTGEHTYQEMGAMLAVPVGTVKWRVAEARRLLKLKMTALGYGHE